MVVPKTDPGHKEQQHKGESVPPAYALVGPHAVVVHHGHASVAHAAVVSSLRLRFTALAAELKT